MTKTQVKAVFFGWIVIAGLMLSFSFILALFLMFSTLQETTFSWLTICLGIIALFSGGLFAGVKAKSKGLLIGFITGFSFSCFVFILQVYLFNTPFSSTQFVYHIFYLLSAMIGSIIGVNSSVEKEV